MRQDREGSRRQDREVLESDAVRETRRAVMSRGPQSLVVTDLTERDLPLIGWSGGPLHPGAVSEALRRVPSGEVEYLAARSPGGHPVSIGGVDYAKEPRTGDLWQLSTHQDLRGLGIGSRLVDAAERRVRARGLRTVVLGVEAENVRARQLYDRLGYVAYGHEQSSWDEVDDEGRTRRHHADLILMRKTLTSA